MYTNYERYRGAPVEFEWDETKRAAAFAERGVDVLFAALIFESPVLTRIDDRRDYGEVRFVSTGMVEGECFVVVHTRLKAAIRLITAWKGGRNDSKFYEKSLARRTPRHEGPR